MSESLSRFALFLKTANKKVITLMVILMFGLGGTSPGSIMDVTIASNIVPFLSIEEIYVNNLKEKFSNRLIKEVQTYITKIAPDSKLTSGYLVEKCVEYDADIVFVLAQALLESHFGTKGKAAETNSVWNVGTYDNGIVLYRYATQDESLEPYLRLVNDKYLINMSPEGDTIRKNINNLLEDRGFINYEGKRYASNMKYENLLRNVMISIDMETSISFYQEIVKMDSELVLAYFSPFREKMGDDYYALK